MSTGRREAILALRAWVGAHLGLSFDDARLDVVGEALARRSAAVGMRCDAYVASLVAAGAGTAEVGELASELTTSESYFFRHPAQLSAFAQLARERLGAGRGALRVLSAGCSTGEEPYTLAMILLDAGAARAPGSARVFGVDVDRRSLARAAAGRYTPWSLRATPEDARARWFRGGDAEVEIEPAVRRVVQLVEGNLVDPDLALLRPSSFDVVFCRNVLMYLTPDAARGVVARLARSLVPGGLLFLGHAETLRGLSDEFDLREADGAFHHVRRARPLASARPRAAEGGSPGAAWADVIRRCTDRIASSTRDVAPAPAPGPAPPAWSREVVLEHLRGERWADARAALEGAPEDLTSAPDVLLLQAVLAAHEGDLASAEATCARLLRDDPRDAGAHHLLALCQESAGRRDLAIHHHREAAALDPAFAMPRLHLGLLARQQGDLAAARRQLSEAWTRLEHEDAARLVLFGGGLEREALRRLCRAELAAAGGIR